MSTMHKLNPKVPNKLSEVAMFVAVAFLLLGIERFLYGYIYHFPESFQVRFKFMSTGKLPWSEVAKQLGIYIKVFQFGVIGYDLLLRGERSEIGAAPLEMMCIGAILILVGQLLNVAVFNAIGAKGVYYGTQFGEDVPWCSKFPYNIPGFSDPQYWGVILFVWGVYCMVSPSMGVFGAHFIVPWLETFWYICSMKLLESTKNGQAVLKIFGFEGKAQ